MGADRNKLLLQLAGRPVLALDIGGGFGIACHYLDRHRRPERGSQGHRVADRPTVQTDGLDRGRASRQESVLRGLAGLPAEARHVLIHDGARCLVQPDLFDRCADAVQSGVALIAATPVTDTIKRVDVEGVIQDTPDRAELWAAQTPQGFAVDQLRRGHAEALEQGWSVTDDASLFERLGWPVQVLDAGPANIKVTTPFDLMVAEAVLKNR